MHPFYCRAGVVRIQLQGKRWPLRATRGDAGAEAEERSASRQRPQALQVAERGGEARDRGQQHGLVVAVRTRPASSQQEESIGRFLSIPTLQHYYMSFSFVGDSLGIRS